MCNQRSMYTQDFVNSPMENETWKDVFGFNYLISSFGNIKNKKTGKTVKPTKWGWYRRIKLFRDGQRYYFMVHRLVAMTFLPNLENKPCVLHNDNNPLNNHVSNLRWGTYLENNLQAIKEGRKTNKSRPGPKGELSPTAKLTNAEVLAIRQEIKVGLSLTAIARQYCTTKGNIWKIKNGYSWSSVV